MKKKTADSFQEWASEVRSKLSPEQVGHFEALVGNPDEGMKVFGGVMAEREFYRHKNELNEQEKTLNEQLAQAKAREEALTRDAVALRNWYDQEEPKTRHNVAELKAERARVAALEAKLRELGLEDELVVSKPVSDPSAVTTDHPLWGEIAQLRQRQALMDQAVPKVLTDVVDILARARKDELDFDPQKLFQTAAQRNGDLRGAFDELTAEQREERAAKQREKELADARAEGERNAMTRLSSPDKFRSTRPVAGDIFAPGENAPLDKSGRIDKAVDEYLKLGPEAFSF